MLASLCSSEVDEREPALEGAAVMTVVLMRICGKSVAACCAPVETGVELAVVLQQFAEAPSGR